MNNCEKHVEVFGLQMESNTLKLVIKFKVFSLQYSGVNNDNILIFYFNHSIFSRFYVCRVQRIQASDDQQLCNTLMNTLRNVGYGHFNEHTIHSLVTNKTMENTSGEIIHCELQHEKLKFIPSNHKTL